jgi:hypothetical protein
MKAFREYKSGIDCCVLLTTYFRLEKRPNEFEEFIRNENF